jgi:hypothetical protein
MKEFVDMSNEDKMDKVARLYSDKLWFHEYMKERDVRIGMFKNVREFLVDVIEYFFEKYKHPKITMKKEELYSPGPIPPAMQDESFCNSCEDKDCDHTARECLKRTTFERKKV